MVRTRTVIFEPTEDKNYGLEAETEVTDELCPCRVCEHKRMEECEESNCQCCSSACT